MICKWCSFECDIGKYGTRSMNKVWAFRIPSYSLDECCIFPYCTNTNSHTIKLHTCMTWLPYYTNCRSNYSQCAMGLILYRYTSHMGKHCTECESISNRLGGGHRVVVSSPLPFTLEFGVRFPISAVWKKQKYFSPSKCKAQYCGEPSDRLRPPGLKFRILCLEDSVISFISPSSGDSLDPV